MEGSAASPAVTAAMVARSRGLAGPRFSPDGRRLAWVETAAGRSDVVVAPADGSAPPVVVTADAATGPYGAFTWAGADTIVYAAADGRLVTVPGTGGPLRVLSPDGEAAAPGRAPSRSSTSHSSTPSPPGGPGSGPTPGRPTGGRWPCAATRAASAVSSWSRSTVTPDRRERAGTTSWTGARPGSPPCGRG